MINPSKTFWDINKNPRSPLQKVNFRQYLTNNREPVEIRSDTPSGRLDRQSSVIEDTYLRKRILRKIASKLRNKQV